MSGLFSTTRTSLRSQLTTLQHQQVRNYAAPGAGKSVLSRRVPRKLTPGKTRPAIYYKFECRVELSDGSTIVRRSQYPRVEWKYLADQRNNIVWNPSRTNLKAIEADATGRLAKFKQKFGFVDPVDSSDRVDSASETKADAAKESEPAAAAPKASLIDDYYDLMGENFVPVQSGGKLAGKRRGKKQTI